MICYFSMTILLMVRVRLLIPLRKTTLTYLRFIEAVNKALAAHNEVGISWAYEHNYEILVTMDCDFTHSPSYIIDFIKLSDKANIVVGSRYMQKDSLATWNLFRKFLTYLGHFLTVNILNMPYDASGAFRLYSLKRSTKPFSINHFKGYSFFFESLFILYFNKITIVETPIGLPSRTYGTSKMTYNDAWKSLQFLLKLYYSNT